MLHRMPAALVWPTLIQLLLLASNAHAAKFDERVSPPPDISPTELHKKFKKQFAAMKEPGGMTKLIRDKAAYRRWADMQWQLGESIDRRRPMNKASHQHHRLKQVGVVATSSETAGGFSRMESKRLRNGVIAAGPAPCAAAHK